MAAIKNKEFLINKEIIYEEGDLHTSFNNNKETKLRIIHFNDVYNIESRMQEPCGGASRFINAIKNLIDKNTLVLFSGDAFSPSNLSILLKGKQMCEILNSCLINVACIGNHDFDFGLQTLDSLLMETKFPWLLSNVKDSLTNRSLSHTQTYFIQQINDLKIGFIGLVEEEWISTLSTINSDELNYESFLLCGKKLARYLKGDEHKCDFVIALTHMRVPNDELLVEKAQEIDLFLGGHDHDYRVKRINDRWLIKSGSDFREFTLIEFKHNMRISKIEKYIVDSLLNEDKSTKELVDSYMNNLNQQLDVVLGEMHTQLDGRFDKIRREETNLGNFVCDIVLNRVDADCCLLNSGSFRSDTLHQCGSFTVRDLKSILPYPEGLLVIEISGKQLYEALENGISQYPKLEGRFPQVGGIRFEYDPLSPSNSRINPNSIQIRDSILDLDGKYKLCTKPYLFAGKDGYKSLIGSNILIDEENLPPLFNLIQDHFNTISKILNEKKQDRLRASIVPLFIVNKLIEEISCDPCVMYENDIISDLDQEKSKNRRKRITFKMAAIIVLKTLKLHKIALSTKPIRKAIKQTLEYKRTISLFEDESLKLAPKIDGRILRLNEIDGT